MAKLKELIKLQSPPVKSSSIHSSLSKDNQTPTLALNPRIPIQFQLNPKNILALHESIGNRAVVQLLRNLTRSTDKAQNVHKTAAKGVEGKGNKLPHLDKIQAAFGSHDLSQVQAYTGQNAALANQAIGAKAYATGNKIAFANSNPDLHTIAHEATHYVQQQEGVQLKDGIGEDGDKYEQHADAVADAVVQGKSAESLLDQTVKQSSTNILSTQMKAMDCEIQPLQLVTTRNRGVLANPILQDFQVQWSPIHWDGNDRMPGFHVVSQATIIDYGRQWNAGRFTFNQYVRDKWKIVDDDDNVIDYENREKKLDNFSIGEDGDISQEGMLSYDDYPGWTGYGVALEPNQHIKYYSVAFTWEIIDNVTGNYLLDETDELKGVIKDKIPYQVIAGPENSLRFTLRRISGHRTRIFKPSEVSVFEWSDQEWDEI